MCCPDQFYILGLLLLSPLLLLLLFLFNLHCHSYSRSYAETHRDTHIAQQIILVVSLFITGDLGFFCFFPVAALVITVLVIISIAVLLPRR